MKKSGQKREKEGEKKSFRERVKGNIKRESYIQQALAARLKRREKEREESC